MFINKVIQLKEIQKIKRKPIANLYLIENFIICACHLYILYPIPKTVSIIVLLSSVSSFFLRRWTCTSTVLVPPSKSYPHTFSKSLSRENTTFLFSAKAINKSYSFGFSLIIYPNFDTSLLFLFIFIFVLISIILSLLLSNTFKLSILLKHTFILAITSLISKGLVI